MHLSSIVIYVQGKEVLHSEPSLYKTSLTKLNYIYFQTLETVVFKDKTVVIRVCDWHTIAVSCLSTMKPGDISLFLWGENGVFCTEMTFLRIKSAVGVLRHQHVKRVHLHVLVHVHVCLKARQEKHTEQRTRRAVTSALALSITISQLTQRSAAAIN